MTAVACLASTALRPAGTGGWVGYWSPGIGDPDFVGWLTVVLYFAATVGCWWLLRKDARVLTAAEKTVWRTLTVSLALLGVNKQLDLQTALTEFGRQVAADDGWYDARRRVQRAFILAVGLAAIAAGGLLLAATRRMPAATSVTAVGGCALLAFVLVRASSFHHVDIFIRSEWWGLRGNWLIEVGGLLVILAGIAWRRRTPSPIDAQASSARADAASGRYSRPGRVLRAQWRMRWLIGATTALGLVGALAIAGRVPPRFRGGTLIQGTWDADDAAARDDPQSRHLRDLQALVFEPTMIQGLAESSPPGGPTRIEPASLRIDPVNERDFSVEYESSDPEQAADVPNRLARLLAEEASRRGPADPGALEARVDAARRTLGEQTDALRRLDAQRPGDPPPPGAGPASRERAELAVRRRSVEAELGAAREKEGRLREELAQLSVPAGPDPQLAADLAALQAQRDRLLTRYTERHPDVEAITGRIRRVESELAARAAASPRPQTADLERQLADAKAAVERLSRERDSLAGELARLPAATRAAPTAQPQPQADREALARDLEQAKAAYSSVREEWRAVEVASRRGRRSLARVEILRPAAVPPEPFYPNRLLFALVGVASGLAAGLGASLALSLLAGVRSGANARPA